MILESELMREALERPQPASGIPTATATSQRTGGVNEARDQSAEMRTDKAPQDAEIAHQREKIVRDVCMTPNI